MLWGCFQESTSRKFRENKATKGGAHTLTRGRKRETNALVCVCWVWREWAPQSAALSGRGVQGRLQGTLFWEPLEGTEQSLLDPAGYIEFCLFMGMCTSKSLPASYFKMLGLRRRRFLPLKLVLSGKVWAQWIYSQSKGQNRRHACCSKHLPTALLTCQAGRRWGDPFSNCVSIPSSLCFDWE